MIAAERVLHNLILWTECNDEEWHSENEDDDAPLEARSSGASEFIAKLSREVFSDTFE